MLKTGNKPADDLFRELDRTGVISEAFKSQISTHVQAAMDAAFTKGWNDAVDRHNEGKPLHRRSKAWAWESSDSP